MAYLMFHAGSGNATVGGATGFSSLEYFGTQLWATAHYLRLVFWPAPLVLDYGDKIIGDWPRLAGEAFARAKNLAGAMKMGAAEKAPAGLEF